MRVTEYQLCRALMDWARIKKWFIFHISNEGVRAPQVAHDQGILAGCPDYFMPVAASGYHGAFLEMKAPGKKPSRKQLLFMELLRRNGYAAIWFDDWVAAAKWIEEYLGK